MNLISLMVALIIVLAAMARQQTIYQWNRASSRY
jgi:hypothetical protein